MEKKKQRKLIIMQSLAAMLEERDLMKVTTAELAKRSEITEAAIYKHFPSKRKIFEELVLFFESWCDCSCGSSQQKQKIRAFPGVVVYVDCDFCFELSGEISMSTVV